MFAIEKCCFCVPRRLGFVIIACLRVIISLLVLWLIIAGLVASGQGVESGSLVNDTPTTESTPVVDDMDDSIRVTPKKTHIIREISIISSIIVDLVLCGLLTMAAVKSHLKLYNVFFYYNIVVAFFTLTGLIVYITTSDHRLITIDVIRTEIPFEALVVTTVLIICVQIYIILLTRSEMMKIKKTQSWNPRTGRNVLL